MRKVLNFLVFAFLTVSILIPSGVLAELGVGVGTSEINFDKPLKMGGIYTLPPLTVINTGDEPADYGVSVEYKQDQPRMSPPKDWFIFTPDAFHLEPGVSQVVEIKANIPIKAVPGDYFAYLEGHPTRKATSAGGVTIGIGAAAKLYFTVAPANIFQGAYYRVAAIWENYAPWTYVIAVMIAASLVIAIFKKFFTFNIGVSKKTKDKKKEQKEEQKVE